MHLQINKQSGDLIICPANVPKAKEGFEIVEVTPEIQAVIDQGGPFKWEFETGTVERFGREVEVRSGGTLVKVVPTLIEARAAKIAELEAARYEAEIVGTTVPALGDIFVRTDKETQSELGKALALLTVDPAFEIDWKFPDGNIVHLDKAAIETVAKVVFTHVQRTRTDYKTKAEAVAAASTLEDIEAIAW